MRQALLAVACLTAALSACDRFRNTDAELDRAIDAADVIEQVDLSDAMMRDANPDDAVAYFARTATEKPGRIDLRRGLAQSLVRAGKPDEAATAWERVVGHPDATPADRVALAESLVRLGEWDRAEEALAQVPPSFETGERYRVEAMIADSNQEWDRADAFYGRAVTLAREPAGVLNNWGFSKLSRGDHEGAERLFGRALQEDPALFTAKNNLVLARGARREYTLPIVEMTQTEKAMLLHTMALAAIKQGDVATGQTLLRDAIDTHPQYFEAAARSLDALETTLN